MDTDWVVELVQSGDVHAFYVSPPWEHKRLDVLELDRYECQRCRAKGRYRRATMVHHVNHLRDRPDLALSIWYTDKDGKKHRQLISLCAECHELEHPERLKRKEHKPPLTPERW